MSDIEPAERVVVEFPSHALRVKRVPIRDLRLYPSNARQGDVGAICESLQAHGQFRPLVVQASTGMVLAGNHTLQAAMALGWKDIAVTMIDVDDEQAKRIVLVDNRTTDLASYDESALADLLRDLADTPVGLQGTGFDGDDLDDLLHDLERQDPGDKPPPQPIIHYDLVFDDEHQQQAFFDAVRWLKKNVDGQTVAARLTAFLESSIAQRA